MSFEISINHSIGDCQIAFQAKSDAQVLAICGPSGIGKTTLLNVIAGLIEPDAGSVSVAGHTLLDTTANVRIPPEKRGAGYVFQDNRLFPHMRVEQNLLFGKKSAENALGGLNISQPEVVNLLGIAHLLNRYPKSLSGGEARRVAIGRALLSAPKFLLLDEPLTSIDAERRADLLTLLVRIRDEIALPMLYVSHTLDDVAMIAQETVTLGT